MVLAIAQGDYGKPRPAVIVQSDLSNATHNSMIVCLLTTELIDAPLFRMTLEPSADNGLRDRSQIMVNKLLALRRDRIRERISTLMTRKCHSTDHSR